MEMYAPFCITSKMVRHLTVATSKVQKVSLPRFTIHATHILQAVELLLPLFRPQLRYMRYCGLSQVGLRQVF